MFLMDALKLALKNSADICQISFNTVVWLKLGTCDMYILCDMIYIYIL